MIVTRGGVVVKCGRCGGAGLLGFWSLLGWWCGGGFLPQWQKIWLISWVFGLGVVGGGQVR